LTVFPLTNKELKNFWINLASWMIGASCQHSCHQQVHLKPVKFLHYLNNKVLEVPALVITQVNCLVVLFCFCFDVLLPFTLQEETLTI